VTQSQGKKILAYSDLDSADVDALTRKIFRCAGLRVLCAKRRMVPTGSGACGAWYFRLDGVLLFFPIIEQLQSKLVSS
jgi:hypothetical protein